MLLEEEAAILILLTNQSCSKSRAILFCRNAPDSTRVKKMSSASLSFSGSRLIPAAPTYPRHEDDYYDIDDILASDSKVSCVFEMQVLRLGFLVPGTSVENIAIGTKMDLPYWLARALCSKRKQIVSVELPKAYKDAYREVIRADANVVNLQKLGPYYYRTGVKLLNFELLETEALSRTLVEVS